MTKFVKEEYFLPYQIRWLEDHSQIKIWDKSRRIGATYAEAFEDVTDCATKKVPSVWFTSADETAAKEYIDYCEFWARLINIVIKFIGESLIESEDDITSLQIQFSNNTKIHALTSSPKTLRSKGGKIIIDEYSHHKDPDELWKAAKPVATWNYPIRILSTHNGQKSQFYKFVEAVKQGKLKWSLHKTDIFQAVDEGLLDKILKRTTTQEERQAWLEELRIDCFDEDTWLQEYCCTPIDESTAFLPYELITSCESDVEKPISTDMSDLYLGMDIGRKKDLSIIWILEKLGLGKYSRKVHVLEKTPFTIQKEILFQYLSHKKLKRACIDATGLGMQLAEEAQQKFGNYKVEAITFTNAVKEELAYNLRRNFEDKSIFIPSDIAIREDLHAVKRSTTISGNIRFDAERTEQGHSDRFWALGLALYACKETFHATEVQSSHPRESHDMLRGYW